METIQLGAEEAIRSWGSTLTSAIAGKRVEILRHGKPVAVLIGLEHEGRPPRDGQWRCLGCSRITGHAPPNEICQECSSELTWEPGVS